MVALGSKKRFPETKYEKANLTLIELKTKSALSQKIENLVDYVPFIRKTKMIS